MLLVLHQRTQDRKCQLTTTCENEYELYELIAPTPTSNRECGTISSCNAEGGVYEYELAPPTPTSDRKCAAATKCASESQYECAELTVSRDRTCCPVIPCANGHYIHANHTATRDRVCKPFSVCSEGEFTAKEGTATSDRRCQVITRCSSLRPVAFELVGATLQHDSVCQVATVCPKGSRQVTPPTERSNTVCKNCDGVAYFQDNEGQRACRAVKRCRQQSEYLKVPPTPTSDGVCATATACTPNEFVSRELQPSHDRQCTACATCGEGLYRKKACTKKSNAVCEAVSACVNGTYQTKAATATTDRVCKMHSGCGATEFMVQPGNGVLDTQCRAHTACGPGSWQQTPGTATSDRVCAPCTPGYNYTTGPGENKAACTPCRVSCAFGRYISSVCDESHDIDCSPCAYGTFGVDGITCNPWSAQCPGGMFETLEPSTVADRLCMVCPPGTFRALLSPDPFCRRYKTCPAGYEGVGGTSSTDQQCQLPTTHTATPTHPASQPHISSYNIALPFQNGANSGLRCVSLSDPSTSGGAGGPNQNTSRIQIL